MTSGDNKDQQPSWEIRYQDGDRVLDLKLSGKASEVWNPGAQMALKGLIEQIHQPEITPITLLDSHQPTNHQPAHYPASQPAALPAAPEMRMLPAARPSNEATPIPFFLPAPTPNPAAAPPESSGLPAAPMDLAVRRKKIVQWFSKLLFGAELAALVMIVFLLFKNADLRDRLFKVVAPEPTATQKKR